VPWRLHSSCRTETPHRALGWLAVQGEQPAPLNREEASLSAAAGWPNTLDRRSRGQRDLLGVRWHRVPVPDGWRGQGPVPEGAGGATDAGVLAAAQAAGWRGSLPAPRLGGVRAQGDVPGRTVIFQELWSLVRADVENEVPVGGTESQLCLGREELKA